MSDTLKNGKMVLQNAELRHGKQWDDDESAPERDYLFISGDGFDMELFITLDKVAADIFDDLEGNAVTRYEHGYKGYDDLVGTIGSVWEKATALFRDIAARVPAESF